MDHNSILQISFYFLVVFFIAKPLGFYIADVYDGKVSIINKTLYPFEKQIYGWCGIQENDPMDWKRYSIAFLTFSLTSILILYSIQRLQYFLPLNPQNLTNVNSDVAFNTAVSFVTNTNWQVYSGEVCLSYFTQMVGLAVQNFLSAAMGLSVLVAFVRGFTNSEDSNLGNFWVDTFRGSVYILLPLSIVLALCLVSQGVIQNFKAYPEVITLEDKIEDKSKQIKQVLPMGPVASQVAIKQLGTNGGGFFTANAAHPFENPTPLTNFLEMIAILLIPVALCYSFGIWVKDKRQGTALQTIMLIIFVPLLLFQIINELSSYPVSQLENTALLQTAGRIEGKETRIGALNSALWTVATTASANGSLNASLNNNSAVGRLIPLWLMDLGGAIFGGVGLGLANLLIIAIITVFIAGLMIGQTPEFLGKKIESFEMKMTSFAMLIMPLVVLLASAIAVLTEEGREIVSSKSNMGLTEILYTFSSLTNNNGSSFSNIHANTKFYNYFGSLCMLIGRYWITIAMLAMAGSLAKKKRLPKSVTTLKTDNALFIGITSIIILTIGALTFFSAFSLGPFVDVLKEWAENA